MKRNWILATLLILTACAAAVDSPTPSPSPTATATLTPLATVTPSTTPTPTVTPTPSNTPLPTVTPTITATPEFHNHNPGGDIFFTPYDDEDCQLPCWQGLRIGESTIDDVQVMFDRVFGLTVSEESFRTVSDESIGIWDVTGTKIFERFWELPKTTYFAIDVVIDIETHTLRGIHFSQSPGDDTILQPQTLQQTIAVLGVPSLIYIDPYVNERTTVTLAYKEGFVLAQGLDATLLEEGTETKSRFCLNGPIRFAEYHVVPPFEDLKNTGLDPVHESWLWWLKTDERSEDVIGLSAEEIGEMALQSDNPCFTIEEPQ